MKDLSDITVCIRDYGKFIFLVEAFIGKCAKVYYSSPADKEFQDINDSVKADGIKGVTRLDCIFEPEAIREIDLFIFPDIGFAGEQKYLRSIGKAVWGAMGVNDLELSRTKFLSFLDKIDLPKPDSVAVKGLTNLRLLCMKEEGKWIKVNRFRACLETYHHIDYAHTSKKIDEWAVRFGGLQEKVTFVVQDEIDCEVEIGYDGWSVDGEYPVRSFQGYELKNELYLGSLLDYVKLPKQILEVNEAMSETLQRAGYRNFLATEIRIKDGVPNFIDPTFRMAGLTQDQLPVTCTNLAEVIWYGANGILINPKYCCEFVAVGTLHNKDHVPHHWDCLRIPEGVRKWVKLYHYCEADGLYHFPPSVPYECDEAGVVIGVGDTIEDCIDDLKEHLEQLFDEPLTCDTSGFGELLEQIKCAEDEGVEFTKKRVPEPEEVMA